MFPLSDEGFRLISRLALVTVLILAGAAVRTAVGRGKKRNRIMAAGTVGGVAFGVLVAMPLSRWLGADVSAVAACSGIVLGWGIAWQFAKHIPRTA